MGVLSLEGNQGVLFVACQLLDMWEVQWKSQVGVWMCVSLMLKMRLQLLGFKERLLSHHFREKPLWVTHFLKHCTDEQV